MNNKEKEKEEKLLKEIMLFNPNNQKINKNHPHLPFLNLEIKKKIKHKKVYLINNPIIK
jgi:hypothetical protein